MIFLKSGLSSTSGSLTWACLRPRKSYSASRDQKLIFITIILLIMREKARGLKLEPSCDDISAGLSLSMYKGPEMTFVMICRFINKTELT